MMGWKSLAAIAALAAFAAACGSDTPTAPKTAQSLDVDALLGQMTMGDVTQNASVQLAARLPSTAALSLPTTASCAFDSASQGFVCAPTDAGGLRVALTYWLYDAAGHALAAADASKTASIRTVTDISGSLAPPSGLALGSSTISSHSDMTMSGLLTGTHTLNGTSNSHYDVTFGGTTQVRTIMDDTSRTANVTLPSTASNGAYWPTAGTITGDNHVVTMSASLPTIPIDMHSVLTFEGGGKVRFDLTLDGVTSTCSLDLSSRTPLSCVN